MSKYKIGWFATGRGGGSRALLQAAQQAITAGKLDARIEFVFCNRGRGETEATDGFLDMVAGYGLPLVTYSYRDYRSRVGAPRPDPMAPLPPWRLDYDREVMKLLEGYHPDLCMLAGYMLINGPELSYKYDFLNLHPAAPDGPSGTWQQVIWKLIENGAATQGVKLHVAIPELDVGPTATYCLFSIRGGPFGPLWEEIKGKSVAEIKQKQGVENALFKEIRRHGAARELPLVVATLRAFSEGKVKITPDKKVAAASGKPIDGYDLTSEIDAAVKDELG